MPFLHRGGLFLLLKCFYLSLSFICSFMGSSFYFLWRSHSMTTNNLILSLPFLWHHDAFFSFCCHFYERENFVSFFLLCFLFGCHKNKFFTREKYSHNGVVVMKISNVIHLINMIKLSVYVCRNFTLNLLKHFIFPTFLNELFFTISDNIFQLQHEMKKLLNNVVVCCWVLCDWLLNQYSLIVLFFLLLFNY